ncbi:hypothetical protein [Desulfitobacterium chlororespirans]|uniref:Uncharacterized protein n=1 Tax=Desulfitobacterium chlororespirans DSM 11544 TaxID=1121395 RepID=A0A1M7U3L5_9FIRM|nr:hypothetical protein [Desulfitobacterium chlororespirans]SHN77599.1 hypothetical protein SAMN02745215_02909 [Desulfitobacterium chlororespirans DSM 11544]
MDFDKYRQVKEVFEDYEVNKLLRSGWVLLSAGFHTLDDGSNQKTYMLGSTEELVDRPSLLKSLLKE